MYYVLPIVRFNFINVLIHSHLCIQRNSNVSILPVKCRIIEDDGVNIKGVSK